MEPILEARRLSKNTSIKVFKTNTHSKLQQRHLARGQQQNAKTNACKTKEDKDRDKNKGKKPKLLAQLLKKYQKISVDCR